MASSSFSDKLKNPFDVIASTIFGTMDKGYIGLMRGRNSQIINQSS